MLTEDNLVLTRSDPSGNGGLQFLYRVGNYGVACVSRPKEEVSQINWEADIIKFKNETTMQYDICHTTELANKTLTFRNDRMIGEFLAKAFEFFDKLKQS